jgi:carbonic anhydrase
MTNKNFGIINKWIRNIKDVYRFHKDEIDEMKSEDDKTNKLIELNVKEQVMNLAKTSIVQHAWKDRNAPHLHGWVYTLEDGLIKTIYDIQAGTHIDPLYEFED